MNRKIVKKEDELNPIQKLATIATKAALIGTPVRDNAFLINPLEIVVDFKDEAANPRLDYGDDFSSFKQNIALYGVQQPIELYKDEDGKYHLAHGFRRLKAVTELIEEYNVDNATGALITEVPFDEVPFNEEEILVKHFTLNTGKPLNDVEIGEGLKRLSLLRNDTNVKKLSEIVGMDYQKAHNIWMFMKKAGSKIKTEVSKGTVSFNLAFSITKNTKNITEQNILLKEGLENAKKLGKEKVLGRHIPKVNREKMPFDVKLKLTLSELSKIENIDTGIINIFSQVIDAVKTNKEIPVIAELLKVKELQE